MARCPFSRQTASRDRYLEALARAAKGAWLRDADALGNGVLFSCSDVREYTGRRRGSIELPVGSGSCRVPRHVGCSV